MNKAYKQYFDLIFAVKLSQRHTDNPAVFLQFKLNQLYPAFHKCFYLTCRREQKDPGHLVGRRKLRIYRHAQMKIFFQNPDLSIVQGIPHSGNRMLCAKPFCNEAAQHI